MPGYIHGLIQVEVSLLVKDGVWAGRERGASEGAGLPHCPSSWGQSPARSPLRPEYHGNKTGSGQTPAPQADFVTGSSGGTPVSSLTTSLRDSRGFIFLSLSSSVRRAGWASELCPPAALFL